MVMIIPQPEYRPRNLDDVFIPDELIEWLEHVIPERCPDIQETERAIWMYAGKRMLVCRLKDAWRKQKQQ